MYRRRRDWPMKLINTKDIDDFLQGTRSFDAAKWGFFYRRLLDLPNVMRDLLVVWEFENKSKIRERLPLHLQGDYDRFWRAVAAVWFKKSARRTRKTACAR